MKFKVLTVVAIMGVAMTAQQGLANYGGDPEGNVENATPKQPKVIKTKSGFVALAKVSQPVTQTITTRISEASRLCSQLDTAYYVDCLGERLQALSEELSSRGDYGDAQKVIADASKKLRRLASENRDRTKQRVKLKTPNSTIGKTTRPIAATKPEAQAEVRRKAEAIIVEAQTKLLRSAANSQRRKSHYEQIAAAMGSESKVLLRSL